MARASGGQDARPQLKHSPLDSTAVTRAPVLIRLFPLVLALATSACASHQSSTAASTPVAPPGITVDDRVETWTIVASDAEGVANALRLGMPVPGGQAFAGQHSWTLRKQYTTITDSAGCRIADATIFVTSTVLMPRWNPPAQTDHAVVYEWDRVLRALALHELGHRQIVLAGAVRIRRSLLTTHAPSCGAVVSTAERVARTMIAEIEREDADYDRATDHGVTQGTTFDPR